MDSPGMALNPDRDSSPLSSSPRERSEGGNGTDDQRVEPVPVQRVGPERVHEEKYIRQWEKSALISGLAFVFNDDRRNGRL